MAITAYGADVVFVPTLEEGRDLACKMQDAGEGVLLDQNNNPANPEAHVTGTGKSGRHIHPPPPPRWRHCTHAPALSACR